MTSIWAVKADETLQASLRQEWDDWVGRKGETSWQGIFRASQLYAVADIWEKP